MNTRYLNKNVLIIYLAIGYWILSAPLLNASITPITTAYSISKNASTGSQVTQLEESEDWTVGGGGYLWSVTSGNSTFFNFGTTSGDSVSFNVQSDLSGLAGDTYNYSLQVENTADSSDNSSINISVTITDVPTVTTNAASSITTTTAVLNGSVNANGLSTTASFEYGLTTGYGTPVTAAESPVTGNSNTAVTYALSGLTPYTVYHFRATGNNNDGTTNGTDQTFTTSAIASIVTTQAVSTIATTTAIGNGNVTDLGAPNPTAHGVCWNTSGSPTIADNNTNEGSASATGAFTSSITGLTPNTTYYVSAYATNAAGDHYGTEVSFTTLGPPTVTTQAVSGITTNAATGNGNITVLGNPSPTAHGICWNTSGTPVIADNNTNEGAASATGSFTSNMTGLAPNTTYYVRAYATNAAGDHYGAQVSFLTLGPTTVTTQAVSGITTNAATGNGNITVLGNPSPTAHGICWNTSGTPVIADNNTNEGAASATGAFTSNMTGLAPNTTYYVRAYATNAAGDHYGAQVSFLTLGPTTVTTQAVSGITTNAATGNGNITALGNPSPTAHGICWNTSGTPVIADNNTNEGAASATGAFTSNMTGLAPNTTYYVRAYATNAAGDHYGTQVSFTTSESPTLTTQAVSSITTNAATGNGNITALGNPSPTAHGICWNTSGTPTIADNNTNEGAASATGAFTSNMTGLAPNTTYYVRAYATNAAGDHYGTEVSFTTLGPPTVTTQAVSGITTNAATGNGNITVLGNPSPTAHGICWNTIGTPTIADNTTNEGAASATGSFTSAITGLAPNTTYYVRAWATNTVGISYGGEVSFDNTPVNATPEPAPEVTISDYSNPILTTESITANIHVNHFDGEVSFLLSGNVPPSLVLSGKQLIGTITTPGTYTFSLTASDGNKSASTTISMVVSYPVVNKIQTVQSIANTIGFIRYELNPIGELFGPINVEVIDSLPKGLRIRGTALEGVFEKTGSYNFSIMVSGVNGQIRYNFTFTVLEPTLHPLFTGLIVNGVFSYIEVPKDPTHVEAAESSLCTVTVALNQPLVIEFVWDCIKDPFSFIIVQGELPSGLMLDGHTGVISGTPTELGESVFVVSLKDWRGRAFQWMRIAIADTVTPDPVPDFGLMLPGTVPYEKVPLYRFMRKDNLSYFFTAAESEKDNIMAKLSEEYNFEGVSHYVVDNYTLQAQPVYRMHNSLSETHFYTASRDEVRNALTSTGNSSNVDGIAFFACLTPEPGTLPVYRFFVLETNSYFYTISESEKQALISNGQTNLLYEGIAWYAYPTP